MTGFGVNVVALRQPLHFQVFSHSKEGIELFLSNIHLAVIHEVHDTLELGELDTFQVQERVLVGVAAENVSEEGTAGGDYHLVCLHLLLSTPK